MVWRLPAVSPTRQDDLDLVRDAAREAGEVARWWLNKGARSWNKSPGNPVTEADIAVNDLLRDRLAGARPDYGWVSEETPPDPAARACNRTFIVDPIDGTRAFMEGKPGFCISIALSDGGRPVLGVLFNPVTGELFHAAEASGAWLNADRITCSAAGNVSTARLIVRPDRLKFSLGRCEPQTTLLDDVPSSIAYRMALVAAGRWDAVVSSGPKADWDLAAASVILQEAGGIVTDLEGKALRFGGETPSHDGLAGAGEMLHPLLLETVRAACRSS